MQHLISRARLLGAALLITTAIACDNPDEFVTDTPPAPTRARAPLIPANPDRPGEAAFVDIANQAPSYGGHYLDANGNVVAYVVEDADGPVVAAALGRPIGPGRNRVASRTVQPTVVIKKGTYTFAQLSEWRDAVVNTVLGKIAGVISDDLDEANNRVTVGILRGNESAEAEVRAQLGAMGIPQAALRFEFKGPVQKTALPGALGDYSDTLRGGLVFVRPNGLGCTVGYTATLANGSSAFVTASHCTTTQYGYDAGPWYQPSTAYASSGNELFDPAGGTCPTFWPCSYYRFADAALLGVSNRPIERGAVYRPSNRKDVGAGSTSIDQQHPYLYVVGTAINVLQGQPMDKIGITTGWTYGAVTTTCGDFWDTYAVRCEYEFSAKGDPGDSGGPVFTWDGEDGIIAYGITFARGLNPDRVMFSKWSNVNGDLLSSGSPTSSINIQTPITMSGQPNPTASVNGNTVNLSWPAVSVSNTSKATRYDVYRSVWDASTYTWVEDGRIIASTSGTSYSDGGLPVTVNTYLGTNGPPAMCTYTYVEYSVRAYNSGRVANGTLIYVRGNADGATPNQLICP